MSHKGRTQLILGASRAKSRKEAAGGVQKFTAPQNPNKNPIQTHFRTKQIRKQKVGASKNEMTGIV